MKRPSFRLVLVLLSLLGLGPSAAADSPLPKVMEHSYEEIKSQFDAWQIPPGEHAKETLLEEHRLSYDERGAVKRSTRRIWRLKSKDVGTHGIVHNLYAPWHENMPTVTARVFDPNGREFRLSKDDVTVSPAGSQENGILSDRMVMHAALPGIKVGAIVEELTEFSDRDPFCEQGTSKTLAVDTFLSPAWFFSVEIDAPETFPIQVLLRPSATEELVREESKTNGRTVFAWSTNHRNIITGENFELEVPSDVQMYRTIVINTGNKWRRIAEYYSNLVDQRLEADSLTEIAKEILSESSEDERNTIEGKLYRCSQWLRRNIRYTGVHLGDAAIVPARATTVVSRRFGDCKDQAALLVGLLRACEIEASVALVNSSTTQSPNPNIPCLNAFNHAIVVVRHPNGNLWVDPTYSGSTARCIPDYLQGRLALIAHPEEHDLTAIATQGVEGNQERETITVSFSAAGKATWLSETQSTGFFAADSRTNAFLTSNDEQEKQIAEYYAKVSDSVQTSIKERSDPEVDDASFRFSVEFQDLPMEWIDRKRFRFELPFMDAIDDCKFFHLIGTNERGVEIPRRQPADCIVPYRISRSCKLIPPIGFRIKTAGEGFTEQIGLIGIDSRIENLEDGNVLIHQSLSVQSGKLSPDELAKLSSLAAQLKLTDHPLNFSAIIEPIQSTLGDARSDSVQQVWDLRQQWLTETTGDSTYDYVTSLVSVGQVDEAREVARSSVGRLPEDGMAHCALALALLHDSVGRNLAFGAEIREAEAAFRKAIEFSPKRWEPYYLLSSLLDVDDYGVRQNNPKAYQEQLVLLDTAESRGVQSEYLVMSKVLTLIRINRIDDAISIASKNNLERYVNIAKAVKAVRASRWGDVVALRERITPPLEREIVCTNAEQLVLAGRNYEETARGTLLLRGVDAMEIDRIIGGGLKLKAVERPIDPNQSPELVAREFLLRIIAQGNHTEVWPDIVVNPGDQCANADLLATLTQALRSSLAQKAACEDRMYDSCCAIPIRIEGDDSFGHIARFKLQVDCDLAIIKQGDKYKVLLSGLNQRNHALHALQLLEDGNPELAKQWIDGTMKSQPVGVLLDPESGNAIKRFWTASRNKNPEIIRTVIQMQLASSEWTPERSRLLHDVIATEKSSLKRRWIHLSILMNNNLQGEQLENELDLYRKEFPDSNFAKHKWIRYQAELGNAEPMREYIAETTNSNDPFRIYYTSETQFMEKDYAAMSAERLARAKETPTIYHWNSCIWAGLFADNLSQDWLEELRGMLKQQPDVAATHTLACAEAEVGDVDRAVAHLRQLVDFQANRLNNHDYWILGRIAEQCGLPERAVSYYSKVENEKSGGRTHELAQRRIAILTQPKESTPAP